MSSMLYLRYDGRVYNSKGVIGNTRGNFCELYSCSICIAIYYIRIAIIFI